MNETERAEGSSQPELERPSDASDEEQVNQRKRDVGRRQRAHRGVLRQIMATPLGREWLWHFLSDCHVFGNPFTPGAPDVTNFNLGEQNVGKRLMDQALRADPQAYVQMQTENGKGL